jgi:hypothetical protein
MRPEGVLHNCEIICLAIVIDHTHFFMCYDSFLHITKGDMRENRKLKGKNEK